MADINKYLNDIMSAIYGEEVRGSIHDAIAAMNEELSSIMAAVSNVQEVLDNINNEINMIKANYLNKTDADDTYLSKTTADDTYLSKTTADGTYLSKTDADDTYLSKTDAEDIYSKKTDAPPTKITYGSEPMEDGVTPLGDGDIYVQYGNIGG